MSDSKLFYFVLLFFFSFACSTVSSLPTHKYKCSAQQSRALLLFKHSLFSINNSIEYYSAYSPCQNWLGSAGFYPIMRNWKTNTDCCDWNGVTCDYLSGDVISLDLSCGMLQGTIHPNTSLFDLPHLQKLNLSFNDFSGSQVPSFNSSTLPSLKTLDLSHCNLMGSLPKSPLNLAHLTHLDLSSNKLNETLPSWLFTLPSLVYFYLENNMFSGDLPFNSFALPRLRVFNLSHNNLTGQIPYALGNLSDIESLDLSSNRLTGEIPRSLGDITNLEFLNLSENNLVGHIPQGKQFKTFDMSSFRGNPKLCGIPLPNKCTHQHEPQFEDEDGDDEEDGFTWRVVMMGYGCGTFVGLLVGYLMLSTGRPKWFNEIADAGENLIHTRQTKRRYIYILGNEVN